MHNGGPFEVRGSIARRLAERRDGVDRLMAPGNEARVAVVVVVAMVVGICGARRSTERPPAGFRPPVRAG
jgi:hypothetical protein